MFSNQKGVFYMEIKKLTVNIAKKRKGVIHVYWIPEQCTMNFGNCIIDEYEDRYEIIAVKQKKMDQFDLSNILFEFIKSPYYHNEDKAFSYLDHITYLSKGDEYTDVYQKLNSIFKNE